MMRPRGRHARGADGSSTAAKHTVVAAPVPLALTPLVASQALYVSANLGYDETMLVSKVDNTPMLPTSPHIHRCASRV